MSDMTLGRRLVALADRLDRLRPQSHDPEAYHLERDEIRQALLREAQALGARVAAPVERGRFETGVLRRDGRAILIERRGAFSVKERR